MKKDLIKLAEEKGFESKFDIIVKGFTNLDVKKIKAYLNNYGYYLWLCELQKWLMDIKSIFVEPSTYLQENTIDYKYDVAFMYEIVGTQQNVSKKLPIIKDKFSSWTEALEEGVFEALKLIK